MKKIDNYSNGKIIDSIVLGIISIGIVALDTYYILSGTIEGFNLSSIILIIFLSFLGIGLLITSIINIIKSIHRKAVIKKVMDNEAFIMAHIDGEKDKPFEGRIILCSKEINGIKKEFESDPIEFDLIYAAKELGIEEIKVLINQNNPDKYVVDTREIEERIVDLT